MPKMKTKSGAKKRLRVRGSGSVKRTHAFLRVVANDQIEQHPFGEQKPKPDDGGDEPDQVVDVTRKARS